MRRHLRRTPLKASVLILSAVFAASLLTVAGCGSQATGLKNPTKTAGKAIPASKMLTQDDLLYADLPFGPDMSPDGRSVMWVVGKYKEGSELPGWKMFVADLATLSTAQVAEGDVLPAVLPRWSPDGAAFAFVTAAPDGTNQVFTVPAQGGTPAQLTNEPGGIMTFAWRSPDAMVFVKDIPGAESAAAIKTGDDTIHVTETTDDKARLFQVDLATAGVKPVTDNDDQVTALWVSPDGSKAFVTRTRATGGGDSYYEKVPVRNYLVQLDNGRQRQTTAGVQRYPERRRGDVVEGFQKVVRAVGQDKGAREHHPVAGT